MSCPSSTFCEAVDADGNAFTYNGSAWSRAVKIDPTADVRKANTLNWISCPTTTFCAAIDQHGNVVVGT